MGEGVVGEVYAVWGVELYHRHLGRSILDSSHASWITRYYCLYHFNLLHLAGRCCFDDGPVASTTLHSVCERPRLA